MPSTDTRERIISDAMEAGAAASWRCESQPDVAPFVARINALRSPVERGEGALAAGLFDNARELREVADVLNLCIDALEGRDGADVCTELAVAGHRIDMVIEAVALELAPAPNEPEPPPVPVEGERGAWLDEYERLKVAYVEATLSYNHEDNHAQGGVGSHSEVVTDTEVRATERALDAHINALAALPVQPDREHVGTSSDQVDTRAAITRLYLAAHRAGVEAAADHLRLDLSASAELDAARETLAADARADTEDEWNWTDPGSPLAQALAALPVQGERERPFGWYVYRFSDGTGTFGFREPANRPGVQHVTALYAGPPVKGERGERTAGDALAPLIGAFPELPEPCARCGEALCDCETKGRDAVLAAALEWRERYVDPDESNDAYVAYIAACGELAEALRPFLQPEEGKPCGCRVCIAGRERPIPWEDREPQTMTVCPICRNKRCPHADDHRNACTRSNEPGQVGTLATPEEP